MSNRVFILCALAVVLLGVVVVLGVNRGWFSDGQIGGPETNGVTAKNAAPVDPKPIKTKPLSEVLGLSEEQMTVVAGVERPVSDINFAKPSTVKSKRKNPTAWAGVPKKVPIGVNPSVAVLATEMQQPETRQVATSSYAVLEEFDVAKYKSDPDSYLKLIRPNRVNQVAQAGEGVTPLISESSMFNSVLQGEGVVLRVKGEVGMPVTFHTNQYGLFDNQLKTKTLAFDSEGYAEVVFRTASGSQGITNVLVASPVHSNQLKFVVRVLRGESS